MATKSKRVQVGFTEREHSALEAIAADERIGVATVVTRITRAHLATGQTGLPRQPPASSETLAPADEPSRVTGSPAWLPPTAKAAYRDWARDRATAVRALIDRYPTELAALDDSWAKDAPVREQLWALSAWRDLLDTGAYEDPRMELAFASALTDYANYLRDRHRQLARQRR